MTLKIECADDKNKLAFKTNYLISIYILCLIFYYKYIFTYEPIFLFSTFANKSQIEKHAD